MIKKLFIIYIFSFFATTLFAGEKIMVTLVKQYTTESGFVLPNKSIQKKIRCISPSNMNNIFTDQLLKVLDTIQERDFENITFKVMLKYAGAGISIDVESADILDLQNIRFAGDLMIGRRHFVIVENADSKSIIKHFFKKVKGKEVIFQRTYEKLDEIIECQPTTYKAVYNERSKKIETSMLIINGEDALNKKAKPRVPEQTQNYDDSDAFKIDVELFEE